MPAALDHLVSVLAHRGQRQLLGQVTCEDGLDAVNVAVAVLRWHGGVRGGGGRTLQVGDHDLCVVGAGEQVVCPGGEPDRAHVAGVRTVHLDYSPSSDVVQHARAVFLPRC